MDSALKPIRPVPAAPVPTVGRALMESPLFLFFVSVLILYVQFLHNGYECFRSDHITQIPLIFMQDDHGLYPRDWFLTQYGHFDIRFFHLFLIRLFAAPFGLSGGILALYLVLILATLWAWLAISKKLFDSPLPGLITGVAAVFVYGIELGTNHLMEKIMIPRTEAFAFAYWGLFCILSRRPFIAGVLLALSAYCQMAVGAFFFVPILLWMLLRGFPGSRRWLDAGLFIAGFVLLMLYPLLFKAKGFLTTQTVSDAEYIALAAYIRHPHHMIPHLWGGMWYAFAVISALAFKSWRRLKTEYPLAWELGWLAVIIMAILAVATFFIEIVPVKNIIIGQPYRVSVLLYFVLILMLAPHLMRLLQTPGLFAVVRAVCLVLALQNWKMVLLIGLVELVLMTLDERRRPLPFWTGWLLLGLGVAGALGWAHDEKYAWRIILAAVAGVWAFRRFELAARYPRQIKLAAGALVAMGAVLISSFFWLPYERWIDSGKSKLQRRSAIRCYDYQFKPLPIMGLERLGVWASEHTPKNALFLIPPEREMYGFHIWAKRSVVFAFKFFPYNPHGLKEWKERFLALQGIDETDTPRGKMAIKDAMADIGGELVNDVYFSLKPEQVLKLAARYKADYIITRARYRHPRFEMLASDYNRIKSEKNAKPYYLYRIMPEPAAAHSAKLIFKGS